MGEDPIVVDSNVIDPFGGLPKQFPNSLREKNRYEREEMHPW